MMSARPPESRATESAARFLAEASSVLAKSFDLAATLPRAAQLAASHLSNCCLIEFLDENGRPHTTVVASRRAGEADDLRLRLSAISRDPDDLSLLLETLPESFWLDSGLQPVVVEPIYAIGARLGTLVLAQSRSDMPSSEVDSELVPELALRLGTAIHNAHRFMRERRVAHSFQTALLPT